jgi:hypothetical protein
MQGADRLAHPYVVTCQWMADNCLALMEIKRFVWAGLQTQSAAIAPGSINDWNGSFVEGEQGTSPYLKNHSKCSIHFEQNSFHDFRRFVTPRSARSASVPLCPVSGSGDAPHGSTPRRIAFEERG